MSAIKEFLTKKIDPVLEPMMEEILLHKPEDPVDFMINYLENLHNPEDNPAGREEEEEKGEVGSEDENITDEDEEEVEEIVIDKKRISSVRKAISAEAYGDWNKKEDFVARTIPKTAEQISRIKAKLQVSFIFNALDSKEMEVVIGAMEEKKVASGEVVINQGEEGEFLYVVDSGTLSCYRVFAQGEEPRFLKDYQPGEAFGELALLYNAPRAATITAKEDCVLWCLDRATFNNIVKEAAIKKRLQYEEFLKSVKILTTVEPYEMMKIMDAVKAVEFKAGDTIIKEGDEGQVFYLLETGEAYAMKSPSPGAEQEEVMKYSKGDYFGELALLSNDLRAASVFARTDCVCLTLDRHSFKRLLGPLDAILKRNTEIYKKYLN